MKRFNSQHIIEIIGWSIFLIFPFILLPTAQPTAGSTLTPPLRGVLITHSYLIAFYYFNYYYAIPKFFFTGRRKVYGMVIVSCLTLLVFVMLSDPRFNVFPSPPFRFAVTTFIFTIVIRFVMVMLISLGLVNIQRLRKTEQEKVQTELAYLKAQINPHFLFNTLNSIYALSVKKSEAAPESITKLSSIMRYVISDAAHDTVSLEKEVNYLSAYIDLERLRLTDKAELHYRVNGDLMGKNIAPLLFIPLVENAFKHGVSTSEATTINIDLDVQATKLELKIRNGRPRSVSQKQGTGLGLENVKKRLALLYPGKHQLGVQGAEKEFSVTLQLDLS
jgi:hypothetical protein